MSPYVKLGMMKAEFDDACKAINARADEASRDMLSSAMQALMEGDTAERDRLCDKAGTVLDAQKAAKTEAWLRIGEKHGIDRDSAMAAFKKLYH